jgi:hypothetical protein
VHVEQRVCSCARAVGRHGGGGVECQHLW